MNPTQPYKDEIVYTWAIYWKEKERSDKQFMCALRRLARISLLFKGFDIESTKDTVLIPIKYGEDVEDYNNYTEAK